MAKLRSVYTAIKSPLITEKATKLQALGKYAFWVNKRSNKIEIRNAIESIYKVKVKAINIIYVKGRMKKIRWGQEGKTSPWKKAIVTLKQGEQIKIT